MSTQSRYGTVNGQAGAGLKSICFKCAKPFETTGHIALKNGMKFHPACFTCALCNTPLPLRFVSATNGQYYHESVNHHGF